MSRSAGAACLLVLLVLCVGTGLLDLATTEVGVCQLVLILIGVLIGSSVRKPT